MAVEAESADVIYLEHGLARGAHAAVEVEVEVEATVIEVMVEAVVVEAVVVAVVVMVGAVVVGVVVEAVAEAESANVLHLERRNCPLCKVWGGRRHYRHRLHRIVAHPTDPPARDIVMGT